MKTTMVITGAVLGALSLLGAPDPSPQVQPTHTPQIWVPLPTNQDALNGGFGNNGISEAAYLDVLVGGKIRVYYTSEGTIQIEPGVGFVVHPGNLRPIDLPLIPSISGILMGAQGAAWSAADIKSAVENWNQPLDGSGLYGKKGSLNGIISKNGQLFVAVTLRHDISFHPDSNIVDHFRQWNGFSTFYGPDNPQDAFDPLGVPPDGKELYSAGFDAISDYDDTPPTDLGLRQAVPEGVALAEIYTTGGGTNSFVFVANYCGRDAAGTVLAQNINNLSNIRHGERFLVQMYELLADWLLANPPADGSLGAEVPRSTFTCPFVANPPEVPDCGSIDGNKIRPLVVVKIHEDVPINGGKIFLFVGMNLDPVDLVGIPLDIGGLDDGKYDYVAITEITNMVKRLPNPNAWPDLWEYTSSYGWNAHTTFIRLPPNDGATLVQVTEPGGTATASVPIRGAGTPKAMAVSPALEGTGHVTRQFLYVLSSDQSQENVAEQQSTDGGWHIPHLFTINLALVDLTDQDALNLYSEGELSETIGSYRLNKIVKAEFSPGVFGATCIPGTLDQPDTPLTMVSGADPDDVGPYYRGEYQLEPTARTRMHFVHNEALATDKNRLYIGTTGESQDSTTNAAFLTGWEHRVGAVFKFAVSDDGVPIYRDTFTLQQSTDHPYQVSAVDVVPAAWLDPPGARNVLLLGALDGRLPGDIPPPQDRLVLIEDQ